MKAQGGMELLKFHAFLSLTAKTGLLSSFLSICFYVQFTVPSTTREKYLMIFDNQLKMVHCSSYKKMEHHHTMLCWFVLLRQKLSQFF